MSGPDSPANSNSTSGYSERLAASAVCSEPRTVGGNAKRYDGIFVGQNNARVAPAAAAPDAMCDVSRTTFTSGVCK